ncbi:hypothetical protein L202_01593 [Cryptococcus amylolentus CBS 6039]|uniref:rRNA methyltransferase 2, mitochondrial n=2 Tax=Cryptococcus amylolentus CBS 6039 TaxID=1295533 RepID=A0A1E3I4Y6_9TREE|nr:hypothetical protein L202_01593 [Cryptococcus amylolentus CBS 6039]ODN83455.1 hypothetical protein L202_01593 [Cryptococcus amylolentus CBS 6039]
MRSCVSLLAKSPSSSRWLARQSRDPYVRQRSSDPASSSTSNQPSYRSRSSFKLVSLAKSHPVLLNKETKSVVDLGAAPGGWTQVASQVLGVGNKEGHKPENTRVWAIDILPMDSLPNVHILQGNFLSPSVQAALQSQTGTPESGAGVDTVLSDMMAPMTGVRARDVSMSLELCEAATAFARRVLRRKKAEEKMEVVRGKKIWPGGNLVMKFFAHPDLDEFKKVELDPWFGKVVIDKPKESRSESSEAYFVCLGFKGEPTTK